eukprot:4299862-Prymnesium_polylepis.2
MLNAHLPQRTAPRESRAIPPQCESQCSAPPARTPPSSHRPGHSTGWERAAGYGTSHMWADAHDSLRQGGWPTATPPPPCIARAAPGARPGRLAAFFVVTAGASR